MVYHANELHGCLAAPRAAHHRVFSTTTLSVSSLWWGGDGFRSRRSLHVTAVSDVKNGSVAAVYCLILTLLTSIQSCILLNKFSWICHSTAYYRLHSTWAAVTVLAARAFDRLDDSAIRIRVMKTCYLVDWAFPIVLSERRIRYWQFRTHSRLQGIRTIGYSLFHISSTHSMLWTLIVSTFLWPKLSFSYGQLTLESIAPGEAIEWTYTCFAWWSKLCRKRSSGAHTRLVLQQRSRELRVCMPLWGVTRKLNASCFVCKF